MSKLFLSLSTFLIFFSISCSTQTASYHYYQKQLEQEDINFHNTLRVNEYLNAFPQEWLKVPEGKDVTVRVDPMVMQGVVEEKKEIFQIAVKTRHASQEEMRAKLALSLVIDVSGSMQGEKIEDTKKAITNSIQELNNGDFLSIVTFNNDAQVLVSNQVINSQTRKQLIDIINGIFPGGGTNIGAGLIQGYKEMSYFPSNVEKRLLLLTDGQSNVHTLTPEQISREAGVQYLEGARISSIGLGYNVNQKLLRQIADNGKGHYYFAENSKTLTKILRDDLRTTVIPVVKNVRVTVNLQSGSTFRNIYGLDLEEIDGKTEVVINTGELNVNDWRIYIVEISKNSTANTSKPTVGVSYVSNDDEFNQVVVNEAKVDNSNSRLNNHVFRNAVLYGNALSLIESSKLYEKANYQEALYIIETQINNNDVLISFENSEMVAEERKNLEKVRQIILKKSGTKPSDQEMTVHQTHDFEQNKNSGVVKGLVLAGLKMAKKTLPGLWSTVAELLIYAIE